MEKKKCVKAAVSALTCFSFFCLFVCLAYFKDCAKGKISFFFFSKFCAVIGRRHDGT